MGKFAHFELKEFLESREAQNRGILNTPSFEVVENLAELCEKFLEPLREAWGKPIGVTSGFRCPRLNQVVGGVANSSHKIGAAADIQSGDPEKFFNFITGWVKSEGIMFDQIFIESRKGVKWIHVSTRNESGTQRRMISRISL